MSQKLPTGKAMIK